MWLVKCLAAMDRTFTIKSNDRVFFAGKTGAGKTYLAKHLTRTINRLVILDGKGTLKDWDTLSFSDGRRALRIGEPVRIRALPDMRDNAVEYWDNVLTECYDAGNVTIYIDELYSIVPPGQNATPALWGCYTRGREYGVGVWAATQRPVWIPLVALSESEHYFLFRLTLDEDRKRMAAFMGGEVIRPITDNHGFFYNRVEWDSPIYYKRLKSGG